MLRLPELVSAESVQFTEGPDVGGLCVKGFFLKFFSPSHKPVHKRGYGSCKKETSGNPRKYFLESIGELYLGLYVVWLEGFHIHGKFLDLKGFRGFENKGVLVQKDRDVRKFNCAAHEGCKG